MHNQSCMSSSSRDVHARSIEVSLHNMHIRYFAIYTLFFITSIFYRNIYYMYIFADGKADSCVSGITVQ